MKKKSKKTNAAPTPTPVMVYRSVSPSKRTEAQLREVCPKPGDFVYALDHRSDPVLGKVLKAHVRKVDNTRIINFDLLLERPASLADEGDDTSKSRQQEMVSYSCLREGYAIAATMGLVPPQFNTPETRNTQAYAVVSDTDVDLIVREISSTQKLKIEHGAITLSPISRSLAGQLARVLDRFYRTGKI